MSEPKKITSLLALFTGSILAVILFSTNGALAQKPEGITLPGLLAEAYKASPEVAAARLSWQGVLEKYPQARSLPDPTLQIRHFLSPVETRLGPQEQVITYAQKLPYPGVRKLRGDIVEFEAMLARLDYEIVCRNLATGVRSSYHELLYLYQAHRITIQNQKIAGELAGRAQKKYAAGEIKLSDLNKALVEAAQLDYDLITLEEAVAAEAARLNTLLSRDPATPLGELSPVAPLEVKVSLDLLQRLCQKNRPEIVAAGFRARLVEKKGDLLALGTKPKFTLGLSYFRIGPAGGSMPVDDSGRDAAAVNFGVTLPFWSGKNVAAIKQADFNRKKAETRVESLTDKSFARIAGLYYKLNSASRLVRLYRGTLLPQAEAALVAGEGISRLDNKNYSGFLELRAVRHNFQLALVRARADYAVTLVKLEDLVGLPASSWKEGDDDAK